MASILVLLLLLFPILSHAAIFTVTNNCPYTVWPAAIPVGGGQQLNPGQSWALNVPSGTAGGRVWGRTGCSFGPNGQGQCQTGDCGGALQCTLSGSPPTTLAEFSLGQQNNDYYDISVIDGFNVPMDFSPTSNCHGIRCAGDIIGQCPGPLRVPGGCNNSPGNSQFFKNFCGDSYTYPEDNKTFACPTGTDYRITFCP